MIKSSLCKYDHTFSAPERKFIDEERVTTWKQGGHGARLQLWCVAGGITTFINVVFVVIIIPKIIYITKDI